MPWTAKVIGKRLDPNPNNLNILVDIEYTDGKETRSQTIGANDLTDAEISKRCQFFVEAAEARDAAIGKITVGDVVLPRDAMSEEERAAVKEKEAANRDLAEKLGQVAKLKLFLPEDNSKVIAAKAEAADVWAKAN